MAEWVKVGEVGRPEPGQVKVVMPRGERIALANVEGEYFAVDDVCTHDFGPLDQGEVFDHQIECPRHGARFDLRTGRPTMPAVLPVQTYPVRVVGNDIEIEL